MSVGQKGKKMKRRDRLNQPPAPKTHPAQHQNTNPPSRTKKKQKKKKKTNAPKPTKKKKANWAPEAPTPSLPRSPRERLGKN